MDFQYLLIGLILCEVFEFVWQKGDTFKSYIQNLFYMYKDGLLFFILLHPSFFFILYCIFGLGFESGILYLIAIFKFFDIGTKLSVLKKLDAKEDLGEFAVMFRNDFKMTNAIKLTPMLIYVGSFYLFLSFMG